MDFGNCFCVIGSNIAQHRSTFSQLWRLMNWSPHILQDKSVRYAFCHFRPAFTSILTNTTLWYFCELGTLSILGWQFINNKTQHRTMWASKMKDSLTTWPVMITIDDGSWWIMMMHDDASFRSSGVPGFQGSRVPGFRSSLRARLSIGIETQRPKRIQEASGVGSETVLLQLQGHRIQVPCHAAEP